MDFLLLDGAKLTPETLRRIGLDYGIGLDDCYVYELKGGLQVQALDVEKYAEKVVGVLSTPLEIGEGYYVEENE